MFSSKPYFRLAFLFIASIVLLWVAIYNGFPIVYSDTSTYLSSGFEFETPADRPITYGLFIYLTSIGGTTLWLTALAQCLIIVYVIYLLFKYFTRLKDPALYSLFAVVLLSVFSSLPWIGGMLLADIFTPVTIFSLLILVFGKDIQKLDKVLLYVLFFLSNAMHMSHLLINLLLIISILFFSYLKYFKKTFELVSKKQMLILLFITLSGIAIMSSAMSKSKHIFYMGRMVENGILKKYLDENCATKSYQLCAYKDSLPPNADRFLWDFENSPVYKLGGWKTTKEEFNTIISETFTRPEYIALHLKAAASNTLEQLTTFNLGEGNIAFPKGTKLHERIGLFTNDLDRYESSKQTKGELLLFNQMNNIQLITVYVSLLLILIALFGIDKTRNRQFFLLSVFVLAGLFFNDMVCASLSTVANRFAVRVMWMIPLLLLLLIFDRLGQKRSRTIYST